MDKVMFKSYKFKPSDVIEGLNRYFAESKAFRYRRVPLEIKNGEVKPGNYYVLRNIVFDVNVPKIKELGYYYLICDPEEVVGVAINWLREEHDIFYTPGMNEPTIKDPDDIDDFCVDDAAKEYEKATRKDRVEELQESRRDLIEALQKRLHDAKRRIIGLEQGHAEKSKIIDQQVARIKELEEQLRKKTNENSVLRGNLDYFANLAQVRQKTLANLHGEIDKIYREIFDCSNGDPEGTYKETMNDILTEYKRVLNLKNVAEEKTIKWKERARENEEKAAKYKELAKEKDQWKRKAEDTNIGWEADRRLTNRLLNEQRDFITKVAEILDVKNPYIESEYASAIGKLRTTVAHPNRYKWLYENLKDGMESVLQEAEERED